MLTGHMRRAILFLQVFTFTLRSRLLVRLSLPTLESTLEPKEQSSPQSIDVHMLVKLVELSQHFGKPVVLTGCLTRGITLYYFLRRAGVPVTLSFGIGGTENKTAAHCWLSKDGEPFLEKIDPRPLFTVMYSIPNSGIPQDSIR